MEMVGNASNGDKCRRLSIRSIHPYMIYLIYACVVVCGGVGVCTRVGVGGCSGWMCQIFLWRRRRRRRRFRCASVSPGLPDCLLASLLLPTVRSRRTSCRARGGAVAVASEEMDGFIGRSTMSACVGARAEGISPRRRRPLGAAIVTSCCHLIISCISVRLSPCILLLAWATGSIHTCICVALILMGKINKYTCCSAPLRELPLKLHVELDQNEAGLGLPGVHFVMEGECVRKLFEDLPTKSSIQVPFKKRTHHDRSCVLLQ